MMEHGIEQKSIIFSVPIPMQGVPRSRHRFHATDGYGMLRIERKRAQAVGEV
jgi:hypothetical protein